MPAEEIWARLSAALAQIQQHNLSHLSYEEHYRYAYQMILVRVPCPPPPLLTQNQQGDMLYHGVQRLVAEHLARQCTERLQPLWPLDADEVRAVAPLLEHPDEAPIARALGLEPAHADAACATIARSERFLHALTEIWNDHCACMSKIRDVLKYVDRVYVPQHQRVPIWELGLVLFRDTVLHDPERGCFSQLMATLLRQVYCEREGAVVERSTIKAATDMLLALPATKAARVTVYAEHWEPLLLAASSDYYAAEAARLLALQQATFYVEQAERRLLDEDARVAAYLHASTGAPLQGLVERRMISEQLDALLAIQEGGVVELLTNERLPELGRLYRLLVRVPPGLPALQQRLQSYVQERGNAINDAALAPRDAGATTPTLDVAKQWVEQVLALKTHLDALLHGALAGDKACEAAMNEATSACINRLARAPEFLSLYLDDHLRKNTGAAADAEREAVQERTMTVFRFVHEKDVFERYYKLHLTRRLLQQRTVSDDAERSMVAKLKVECGHGYVQKMQGMLNDLKLSDDMQAAWTPPRAVPMHANVLTATYWPITSPATPCLFPPPLRDACAAFEAFYASRHRGRVLAWQPQLGTAEVRVRFRARSHDLVVSTFALMVLLLFSTDAPLSYTDIQAATRIAPADLQRTLQSLACAKYKVLTKQPKGRDVLETDTFTFNAEFTCPLARIKIAQIAAKAETPKEREATTAKVEEERKSQVEVRSRADPGVHRAHHEKPQDALAQRPRQRGRAAAAAALPADPGAHQEAHRVAARSRYVARHATYAEYLEVRSYLLTQRTDTRHVYQYVA